MSISDRSPNEAGAANPDRIGTGPFDGSAFAKATADKPDNLSAPKAFGVAADRAFSRFIGSAELGR